MWAATIPTPVLPDPTDLGWTLGKEGHMQPRWTTTSAASVSLSIMAAKRAAAKDANV